jgi:hypothetical protein
MYSESLHTLTIVSRTISPLIPIISFCIFEDVYFILELGTVLSRWDCSWTNDANLPWNYLCLLYGPDLQYFDDRKESIHRLPPSQCVCFWQYPFCADRDGSIDVLDLISKQWDDVSVLRVMNVWPIVYGGRYKSFVYTRLTDKYNTRRAIFSILWKWIPKPMSLSMPLNRTFPFDCTDL